VSVSVSPSHGRTHTSDMRSTGGQSWPKQCSRGPSPT